MIQVLIRIDTRNCRLSPSLDDILIYSNDPLEHETHVLQRLHNAGLRADIKKYEFSVTRTKYLGFIMSINSISVDLKKVLIV
jgi:hypothetical protein